MEVERRLLVLYVGAFLSGLLSSGSLAIIWLYWDPTLNACISVNCGCILYSVVTFSTFVGGEGWLCRFAVFIHLPVLLWATCASLFHAYRVCVPRKAPVTRRTVTFYEDGTRKPMFSERPPPKFKLLAAFSVLACVAIFAQAWVVTAGYYSSCSQYRKSVSTQLNANGNLAQLVFERLSCGTVFDFLDYLQPDPTQLSEQYRRSYTIHTSYLLQLVVCSSWLALVLWIVIAAFNIYFSFNRPKI